MNRSSCVRFFSLLSAVLASAVLVVGSSGEALAADPSRPNIVLIISDDLGWNYYGFMDHPVVKTPNLDRLANEGVLFDVGHLTASKCKPSVAGILTGRYCRDLEITGGLGCAVAYRVLAETPRVSRGTQNRKVPINKRSKGPSSVLNPISMARPHRAKIKRSRPLSIPSHKPHSIRIGTSASAMGIVGTWTS